MLGGSGTVEVAVDGEPKERITVEDAPKLYRLVHTPNQQTATLLLSVSDGVEAYDFTFG